MTIIKENSFFELKTMDYDMFPSLVARMYCEPSYTSEEIRITEVED